MQSEVGAGIGSGHLGLFRLGNCAMCALGALLAYLTKPLDVMRLLEEVDRRLTPPAPAPR